MCVPVLPPSPPPPRLRIRLPLSLLPPPPPHPAPPTPLSHTQHTPPHPRTHARTPRRQLPFLQGIDIRVCVRLCVCVCVCVCVCARARGRSPSCRASTRGCGPCSSPRCAAGGGCDAFAFYDGEGAGGDAGVVGGRDEDGEAAKRRGLRAVFALKRRGLRRARARA